MHMVLLIVGVLSGAAGMAMLAYGAANYTAAIGNTLIISGTTAVVGGLIIIGLGAVVARLRRLAEALDRQPVPRIADERFDVGRFEPDNRAAIPPEPASVPSVLQGAQAPSADEGPLPPAVVQPDTHQGVDTAGIPPEPDSMVEAAPEVHSRMDAADSQAEVRPPAEWPRVIPPDRIADDDVPASSAEPKDAVPKHYQPVVPPPPLFERPSAVPGEALMPPASPVILKSGVLDGMAYTLYSDGSIEAELREGTMRFGSIPELRAYMFEHTR